MFRPPEPVPGENTDNITFVNAQQARTTYSSRNAKEKIVYNEY
jgi:hypothetical protein